jgi:hypothetical protein
VEPSETVVNFELYIPYDDSQFPYVVGVVYSEKEWLNLQDYLSESGQELLKVTPEEFNSMKDTLKKECGYVKSVFSRS